MIDMSHPNHLHSVVGVGPYDQVFYICSHTSGGAPHELENTARIIFAAMTSPHRDICVLPPGY